jgi:hypothetical protein
MRAGILGQILKAPVLQFLFAGLILFALFEFIEKGRQGGGENRIVVDRERLLSFMQQRAKRTDAAGLGRLLDGFSREERQALIDDYVEQEALYREARSLNLDKDDPVSRQRLIQQLRFINQGFIARNIVLSEAVLQQYLDAHKDRYRVAPKITFTHVVFNVRKHGQARSLELARAKLRELNRRKVPFHESVSHGDRWLFHRNYVNKTGGEIASHFGPAMQVDLFNLAAEEGVWRGPLRSKYGFHLVMVTNKTAGYDPPLSEVRTRVSQDARQDRLKKELDRINAAIVAAYEVEIAQDLE